jgi:hypothetical protein
MFGVPYIEINVNSRSVISTACLERIGTVNGYKERYLVYTSMPTYFLGLSDGNPKTKSIATLSITQVF